MKSIVISVLMLSMSIFFVSCENEGQLTQSTSDVETQILDKRDFSEHITFTGDLEGEEDVLGCCPNAGPSPEYTLTLSETFPVEAIRGTYDGEIFMNNTGRQSPGDYMVQFFYVELLTGETMYLEIRGGVAERDKRTKVLTVTFTAADTVCEIEIDGELTYTVPVNFILTRVSNHWR